MEKPQASTRELSDALWQAARSAEQTNSPNYIPPLPQVRRLQHLPELAYINQRWVLQTPVGPSRPGVVGAFIRRIKALLSRTIYGSINGYLVDEREFLSHLVKLQNELVSRCEQLTEEMRLLAQMIGAESNRLSERSDILHRLLEERLEKLSRSPAESQ